MRVSYGKALQKLQDELGCAKSPTDVLIIQDTIAVIDQYRLKAGKDRRTIKWNWIVTESKGKALLRFHEDITLEEEAILLKVMSSAISVGHLHRDLYKEIDIMEEVII